MKNNFPLKFKGFDIFIFIFAFLSILSSIIFTNLTYANQAKKERTIEIYYQNQLIQKIEYDKLEEEKTIILKKEEYPNLLGDIVIKIDKEKGFCIEDVTCPNYYCKKQGWMNKVGYPVVCIPNGVYVIMNSTSIDQDTILG